VERRYGQFERRMRLPEYVDCEKIEATYKDGVLRLRMPKERAAKTKPIQIKTE
jgi:HSP20 family protein